MMLLNGGINVVEGQLKEVAGDVCLFDLVLIDVVLWNNARRSTAKRSKHS